MNVPKLRFKEFNNSYVTEKLNKLVSIYDGTHETPNYTSYGVKFVSVENINSLLHSNKYISLEDFDKYKIKPKYNDVFMTRIGDIGTSTIYKSNDKLAYYVSLALLRSKNQSMLYPDYLNQYIKSNNFQKELYKRTIHVAFPQKINTGEIGKCDITIPEYIEQKKISKFLSLLEKKIELQTNKIEALKLFKKGLSNIFFQNKQPNITIDNCISYGKAGGTPSSNNKDYYDGNISFLSISDMTRQGKYILKTEKAISQQGIKNSSAWIVPKDSIILSMYASYGLIAINKIELATSQAMFNMIVNPKNNVEYIYYYLEFLYDNNYYEKLVSIGTQANLNADKVKKIKIYLPDINVQNQISNILKAFDDKIEYENKKESELKRFKQCLMQNMFV